MYKNMITQTYRPLYLQPFNNWTIKLINHVNATTKEIWCLSFLYYSVIQIMTISRYMTDYILAYGLVEVYINDKAE